MLTHPSTGSCRDRSGKDCGRRASDGAIAMVRTGMAIELEEAIERALKPAAAGEVLPAKREAPMLVEDRCRQPLDEPVCPGAASSVSRGSPGGRSPHAKPP